RVCSTIEVFRERQRRRIQLRGGTLDRPERVAHHGRRRQTGSLISLNKRVERLEFNWAIPILTRRSIMTPADAPLLRRRNFRTAPRERVRDLLGWMLVVRLRRRASERTPTLALTNAYLTAQPVENGRTDVSPAAVMRNLNDVVATVRSETVVIDR